jgi:alpha-tubulin suppressor-like RCC1 family protein
MAGGSVRCWGRGSDGQLGLASTANIGDNELPSTVSAINLGGNAVQIAAGTYHTCALLDTGKVRCWGQNLFGQLGYGHTNNIGDNETPASAGDISLGGTAIAIEAGGAHTCAVLTGGTVRCWGQGFFGALGYANTNSIGDNEHPSSVGTVSVGGTVIAMELGDVHTCAVLSGGTTRCWGQGGSRLGYGHTNVIGDNEHPSAAGNVPTGIVAEAVALGGEHSCALSTSGKVRCWGSVVSGGLGYASTAPVDRADLAGDIKVGGSVAQLVAGYGTICARLDSGAVRCWGNDSGGILGYGSVADVGDNETPAVFGDVRVF